MNRKALAALLSFGVLFFAAQFASATQAATTNTASGSDTKACTAGDYKCDYKLVNGSPEKDAQGLVCMRAKPCNYTCPADQGGGTIIGACLAQDSCQAETTCNGQQPQKYTTQQIQSALNGSQSSGTNANAIVSQDFQSFPTNPSAQTGSTPADQSASSNAGGSSSNLPTSPPAPSWIQTVGTSNLQNAALPYANQSVLTQSLNALQGNPAPGSQVSGQTTVPTTPEQYLQSTFGTTPSGGYQSSGVSSVATNYMQTLPSGDTAYIIPPNDPLNQEIQNNLSDANAVTNSNFTVVTKLSDGSLALLPGDQYGISGSGYAGVNADGLKNENLTGSGLTYPFIAMGFAPAPQAESQKLDYMLEGESYYGTSASTIFSSQNSATGATVGQDLSQLMSNSSANAGLGTWISDNVSLGSPMMAVSGSITNSSGDTSDFSSNLPIPMSNVAPPINPNNTVYVDLSPPTAAPDTASDWQPSPDNTVVPPLPDPIIVPEVPEMQSVDQTASDQGSDTSGAQTPAPASQSADQQAEQTQIQQLPSQAQTPPQESESQAPAQSSDAGVSGNPTGSGSKVSSGSGSGGGTQTAISGGATGGSSLNTGGSSASQILGALVSGLSGFFGGVQSRPTVTQASAPVVYSATEPIVSIPATSDGLLGPCPAQTAQTNTQQRQPCGATSDVPAPQLVSSLPLAQTTQTNSASAAPQQSNSNIPQTILPGTAQSVSGNSAQPGNASQTAQPASSPSAPIGSPSQTGSSQGNNTPVNRAGEQQGPTGAQNPSGSQQGGTGAPSTKPGSGGAQPSSNPQPSEQAANTQSSGQGSNSGSNNASAGGSTGALSGSGSQTGVQDSGTNAQPESLFQQVLRFVSDSIVAPAVASEGNGRLQLLNQLKTTYDAFNDAAQRAKAAGRNPSALPPLKEAIAAGERIVTLSKQLLRRSDIGNGYKTSIRAVAARVRAQAAPIQQLLREYDSSNILNGTTEAVGAKMSKVFPAAIPAALNSVNHLYKTSIDALQHPLATIAPIGKTPASQPSATPIANNTVNQPNPNPLANPIQNNPAPPAQTQPEQPSPPVPAPAPQRQAGNINSVSDRTAVAQQAYQMAMSQGIRPNDLVPGNANYGKAWNSLVQDVRQSLGSRGMLNPQLDTAFIAAVARQETDVPGNPREFQSQTGVRGVMQVTTGDAHSVLGYGSVNTWTGPLNTASFAREDNMGSVITAAIELNGLLFKYGSNMSAAAQVYNSGSTNSCIGGGCVNGVPTYGPRVQYDASVMRGAQQSCNGDTSCIAEKLASLSQGRSRTPQSLADFSSILSGSNAPVVCSFQGCAANPSIKPGNAGYAQGVNRVSSCPSSGYCYFDPQTGAYGVVSDQTMTKQQFLQAAREDDAIERLVQSGKLTAQQAAQDSFRNFKATLTTGAQTQTTYTITDQNGNVIANNVPLPAGAVGPDGTVRLLANADGQPLGSDGTSPLANGSSPLLVSSDSTLPQPTSDQKNPNQQDFPDNRPAPPPPPPSAPPGTYVPPSVIRNGNQRYCMASYQPYVWTPCSTNGLSPSFPIQQSAPLQLQPQPISQPLPQPALQPGQSTAATSTPPSAVAITASPASVASGGSAKISWSSVGTSECSVVTSSGFTIGTTTAGSVFSSKLSTTTRFTAQCQTLASTTISTSTSVIVQ